MRNKCRCCSEAVWMYEKIGYTIIYGSKGI